MVFRRRQIESQQVIYRKLIFKTTRLILFFICTVTIHLKLQFHLYAPVKIAHNTELAEDRRQTCVEHSRGTETGCQRVRMVIISYAALFVNFSSTRVI
jgi:hypothetical protein